MRKEIVETEIICNAEIAGGIYSMTLQCGEGLFAAAPGQFINLYLNDKSMLLPRPLCICRWEREGKKVIVVYRVTGKGTRALSGYQTGDRLRISTPLGRGYDLKAVLGEGTVALVAGGLGIPSVIGLAEALRKRDGIRIIAVLGFRDEEFLTDELRQFCDEVLTASENGSAGFRGSVLDLLEKEGIKADYYFSCGPKPMLKALALYCAGQNKPLQVSLEERMGCGYGACVGCTCKTKQKGSGTITQKKVCKDGPVFFAEEVIWDE